MAPRAPLLYPLRRGGDKHGEKKSCQEEGNKEKSDQKESNKEKGRKKEIATSSGVSRAGVRVSPPIFLSSGFCGSLGDDVAVDGGRDPSVVVALGFSEALRL